MLIGGKFVRKTLKIVSLVGGKNSSSDACGRVRQCDGNHSTHVLETVTLPDQMAGSEGLLHVAPDTEGAQATDAGLFPDDLVAQSWHRYTRGGLKN